MHWKTIALVACGVSLAPVAGLALLSALSRRPANLGVSNGRLAACPNSPNCVSTEAGSADHRMSPISFSGPDDEAFARIKTIVRSLPRTTIVAESGNYLHVEFASAVFRFVDDVEFLVDAENRMIHFRSASRAGHGDLGVNRRRMKAICDQFQ